MSMADEAVVADDGCRLWARASGAGTPVLTCHGGPGLWDMFGDLTLPGVRLLRWDQRGCGRSERRGPYTVARTVADMEAVRQHFGCARVAVLGHSWGAELALRYALAHPERVSGLVYVSGTGLEHAWHAHYHRNLAARLGAAAARLAEWDAPDRTDVDDRELAVLQWSADFADPDTAPRDAQRLASPWFPINHECNRAMVAERGREPDLTPACRNLRVPTLIVVGGRDIRPGWAVDSLERALPSVRRVTLPDSGHVPWLDSPAEFRAELLAFLRQ